MNYFKLQLGCLVIILYIVINYIRETIDGKIKCNFNYDLLMIFAPLAIIFDGVSAWTVNHLDVVPHNINLIIHLAFFIFADLVVIFVTRYIYEAIFGKNTLSKFRQFIYHLPGIISIILVIAFIKNLEFITGVTTNYSMGISVYVSYACLIIHFGFIFALLVIYHKNLPKDKKIGIFTFISMTGIFLLVQTIYPESLISALFPTYLMLGLYIDFENPFLQKLSIHNSKVIEAFATLVESRDNNTGGHIKRTKQYVDLILRKIKNDNRYKKLINKDYLEYVSNAAPLHDIGKIATPDEILQKPGKLTDEEYAIMKEHATNGARLIEETFTNLDNKGLQKIIYEVAKYHHEKYNGRGYPENLKGEEIPLHARIMAIADVFDAISQNRCYRKALPIEECFSIIEKGIGEDFDPNLAKIFLDSKEEVTFLVGQSL